MRDFQIAQRFVCYCHLGWVQEMLLLINDRLGNQPIYYSRSKSGLIFASGVRALLVDPTFSRQTDLLAIAQFLTFDHVLDYRTLLEQAKLLPQASILTFRQSRVDGREVNIRPYWTLKYADTYPLCNETDLVEELNYLIRQAVTRQASGGMQLGILLSGGLDSRILLGELAKIFPSDNLFTFTWGIPGCDDCRAAKEWRR
jgi:asparagine synthase (glutamine-hydrolysing)